MLMLQFDRSSGWTTTFMMQDDTSDDDGVITYVYELAVAGDGCYVMAVGSC